MPCQANGFATLFPHCAATITQQYPTNSAPEEPAHRRTTPHTGSSEIAAVNNLVMRHQEERKSSSPFTAKYSQARFLPWLCNAAKQVKKQVFSTGNPKEPKGAAIGTEYRYHPSSSITTEHDEALVMNSDRDSLCTSSPLPQAVAQRASGSEARGSSWQLSGCLPVVATGATCRVPCRIASSNPSCPHLAGRAWLARAQSANQTRYQCDEQLLGQLQAAR